MYMYACHEWAEHRRILHFLDGLAGNFGSDSDCHEGIHALNV